MADDILPSTRQKDARQNEAENFAWSANNKVVRRVEDEIAIDVQRSILNINENNAYFSIAQSSGFLDGETYDAVVFNQVNGDIVFNFALGATAQFLVRIEILGDKSWRVTKESPTGFLLQENGDIVLQEIGDAILIEGLIPA